MPSGNRGSGRAAAADSSRRSVIVTFKPKDKRPDSTTDKVEILTQAISSPMQILDASDMITSASMEGLQRVAAPNLAAEPIGFDVNLYEAPIVSLSLTEAEIRALTNNPNIASVEDDGLCYALPMDSLVFEDQPVVAAETVPVGVSQIKAPPAWGSSRGKGIRVAVLDTGIDWTHPDLAANVKGAVSFVPGETAMDGNSHGTHCAGIIGAAINGIGVVGVAPEVSLYAVKVLSNAGSGSWSFLIAGLSWCVTNNIRIASMSLGGLSAPAALKLMCDTAFDKGVLLVAAAGNRGSNLDVPGAYKKVISVGAIDSSNVRAPFSAHGPELELCAPGVNVLSTIPAGGYGKKTGTSMACPHVSGAAAVAWGAHRFATNVQIWNLLADTADNLGSPGWDGDYGYGRVDADQAAGALTPSPTMPMKP